MSTEDWPLEGSSRAGPLSGVRVVDLTTIAMGPYATQILGDMGADVIKVESPVGDLSRDSTPARSPGMSAFFMQFNRSKRFMVLDLKQPKDVERFKELISEADVFVTNVRPKALRRLTLDLEHLLDENPRLICCAAVGFGQGGPYADKPAFDDVIQSASGLAYIQGHANQGTPTYIKTLVADKVSGLTLAYAIPMALYEREKSNRGQIIEVPMFETMVSFGLLEHMGGESFIPAAGGMGYERVLSSFRHPYRTSDGYIAVLPMSDSQWRGLFKAAGRGDLVGDPRFSNGAARAANFQVLCELLEGLLSKRLTSEWVEALERSDVPFALVNNLEQVLSDEHLHAVEFFPVIEHPTEGPFRTIGIPVKFSRTPGQIDRLPARLGVKQP